MSLSQCAPLNKRGRSNISTVNHINLCTQGLLYNVVNLPQNIATKAWPAGKELVELIFILAIFKESVSNTHGVITKLGDARWMPSRPAKNLLVNNRTSWKNNQKYMMAALALRR